MAKDKVIRKPAELAADLGNLTFQLLVCCHEKETKLAAQFGLTSSEFRTLRVFQGDKVLHVKELIDRVGLSGSRLTRILDGLEKKGFLRRDLDSRDRRSIVVTLTEKGATISQRLEARFGQIHQEILADVPEEMHEPLMNGLGKMLLSLNQWLRRT